MSHPPPYDPYGPQPYPPYGYPAYGYPPRTNTLAIVALVCSVLFAPLGIVFGHMSLSQIKRTGEEGRGLAIAGLVMGYLFTAVIVVVVAATAALSVWAVNHAGGIGETFRFPPPGATGQPTPTSGGLPAFSPPPGLGENCRYPRIPEPAGRTATPPRSGRVPTVPKTVPATITTNRGVIGVTLDNGKSPCTVNSFVSLAQQGFFDDTRCHRLTAEPRLKVLQCGDPSATGAGGPGYRFANEYPTNQYRLSDPALRTPVTYPRGTVAMANAGPDTNGSQFFIVYGDSELPPTYHGVRQRRRRPA